MSVLFDMDNVKTRIVAVWDSGGRQSLVNSKKHVVFIRSRISALGFDKA
jgi:hypothetical protein